MSRILRSSAVGIKTFPVESKLSGRLLRCVLVSFLPLLLDRTATVYEGRQAISDALSSCQSNPFGSSKITEDFAFKLFVELLTKFALMKFAYLSTLYHI